MRTISYRDPIVDEMLAIRAEIDAWQERKESRETEETGRDARERWPIRR